MASTQTRTLFSNASALFAIQIASYILPFLLIPYLTRVLGAPLYGVIAFGLAMVQIACVITDYGFGLSATYQIAKQQEDRLALRKIISSVIICKIGLLVPVILLLSLFISFQEKYSEYQFFFWLLLLPIIGQTFQPVWFFQGIERMTLISIYTIFSRILYMAMTVLWVSTPADYYWVAVANGMSSIVAAIIGLGMILRLGYPPKWGGWCFLKETFKSSTEFFWSRAAVATYTSGGAFFLGLVSTPTQVAYYSAAEQLYKGAQSLFSPVSQALYPHMAKHRNFSLFFKILKAVIALGISGLIFGYAFGPWMIKLIFGQSFSDTYPVFLIFMVVFAITTPSVLLGYPFLGALGNSKSANLSVIYAGAIQVALLLVCYLANFHQATHVAFTVLAVEIFVLTYRSFSARTTYKTALKGVN